jgi:hypothetical protein
MGAEEGGAKSCLLRGYSVPAQPRADRAKSHHVPHNNLKQAARPFPEIFVGMGASGDCSSRSIRTSARLKM